MEDGKRFGSGTPKTAADGAKGVVDPGSQDDLEDGEEATFEEYVVNMIEGALEEGVPVGVSFDEEIMTVMRSMVDATHKQTAAIKEQNKLIERIANKYLETKTQSGARTE